MKKHIVALLLIAVVYVVGRRVLDLLLWREFEREVRREGQAMSQVISDYREIGGIR